MIKITLFKLPPWRHWPLVFAALVALFLWWLGPTGLAIFWPLVLVALFAMGLWFLGLRSDA
jgi:hypothetical protein